MTIAVSLSGAAILAVGMHLSYVNVEPQRARTRDRDAFVMETLNKKYGYTSPYEKLARNGSSVERSQESSMRENYARARNDLNRYLKCYMSSFILNVKNRISKLLQLKLGKVKIALAESSLLRSFANSRDADSEFYMTALHVSAVGGQWKIVEKLVQHVPAQ
ncbi:hypothetical protein D0Y65_047878 [Glycine soja]|uniref:Uncharacterized protein n=1 Tax=Glycine soja TaxID=3848 RepID=A0A445FQT1_GLYSO|nr:hypothetical protein D0Y65_047878 [Glycine soja]